jgi:phosphoglycerate dehydrogenase-like enzyme
VHLYRTSSRAFCILRRVGRPVVAVTFEAERTLLESLFGDAAEVRLLAGAPAEARRRAFESADVVFAWNWRREVDPGEARGLPARFVQMLSAGVDHLPFDELPAGALVASNAGAYAEPMAEHAVAMALALMKRLPQNHALLAHGEWNQHAPNRSVDGAVCGILGFGGIGRATARLLRALGARIHAVNTTGCTSEPVDFVGTLADLDPVLAASDVLVVALPLTRATRRLIGARELQLMKPDAVLVNIARAAIVDEAALYEHLRAQPDFSAGIDVWWVEPFSAGAFRVDHPFFELPNVLGSPHNSAQVPGVMDEATRRAAENIVRFLRGGDVAGLVQAEDYDEGA